MNWAVVHHIHVRTPHRHIPKLFVVDVPEDVTARELRSLITRAGYRFGEFNIPWANHYLAPEPEWEDEVEGAFKRGGVDTVSWDEIASKEEMRRITIRVPAELYEAVAETAKQQGVSLNTFCVSALSAAVSRA